MRAFVFTSRGERPNTSITPLVGCSNPSSILIVVDFPEPFGPSNPNTSPRRTSKSTPSTARALGRPQKSLKTFVNPRTAMMVSGDSGLRTADCGLGSMSAGINYFVLGSTVTTQPPNSCDKRQENKQ